MHVAGAYGADQPLPPPHAPCERDKQATLIDRLSNSPKALLYRRMPGIRPNQYDASEQLFDLSE